MALVIPDQGEVDALEYFTNRTASEDLVLRLYGNNVTPAETDTAASYTELAGNGYAPIVLNDWDPAVEGSPSSIAHPTQSFNFLVNPSNVYGYFMTRSLSGRIAVAERFTDGPYTGNPIRITPRLTGV